MNRAAWDRHADAFEETVCDVVREETSRRLDRFVAAARPSARSSVLVDLGCGVGSFVRKYGSRFRRVYAIDFAPRIIARARAHCAGMRGISWHAMDAARAPEIARAKADLAVCLNVITSPSAAKRNALWASLAAVTKPAGQALIVVPSIESCQMVESVERRLGKHPQAARQDGTASRDDAWQKHYAREELSSLLSALGFRVKRLGEARYPWATEGLQRPRAARAPWDWICLAERTG